MSTPQRIRVDRLVSELGGRAGGEFLFGGVPVSGLAAAAGTPFYAYNGDWLLQRLRLVRRALGPETSLFYSLKANPSLALCQLIAQEGAGAELASIGELLLAERAGFSPENIIFAGPGKTDEELETAVAMSIATINAESAGEIERLALIAEQRRTVARVSLRVNPLAQLKGAQMRMGGGPQQFGIDEEQVPAVVELFLDHPHLELVGIHVYAGTQMADVPAVLANCENTLALGRELARQLRRPLRELDFGGGFAVPYFENSPDFDLDAFSSGYRELIAGASLEPAFQGTRFIVELGRYLVAEAGVYVTRVLDVKTSRGKRYVITDGGMNHHITATGNFGQVFRKAYPIAVLNRLDDGALAPAAVAGPCCTPLDVLGQNIDLPDVAPGDLVGVFCSGAYGYSASSLYFLSHPTPAEVLVLRGEAHLLRRAGRPDQVLEGQEPLGAVPLRAGRPAALPGGQGA